MQTGHLLEALQHAKVEERMALCRKHQRLVLSSEEVAEGFAWQLRMIEPERGGKLLANDLLQSQPKKAAYWTIMMVEVNWDYHVKGNRFMFKEVENEDRLKQANNALQNALEQLAPMNRASRLQCQASGEQPAPPVPVDYPSKLQADDASWTDEPIVVWLSPVRDREAESAAAASGGDRSVRPRRDDQAAEQQQWSDTTWSYAAWQNSNPPWQGWRRRWAATAWQGQD